MSRSNFQSITLVILILVSLVITKEARIEAPLVKQPASFLESVNATTFFTIPRVYLTKEETPIFSPLPTTEGVPTSFINFQAQAVLVSDLDNNTDLISYNINKRWPLASITKLMTAVLAFEEIGGRKEILISETAVAAEGDSGKLKVGELYKIDDLINLMLITSSNDAAAALAEFYAFGSQNFVKLMNKKAAELGMNQTVFFDPAGLSPLNQSTVNDIQKLMKYIEESHPEILVSTRPTDFKGFKNINPFAGQANFLGGKTGYLEEAKENLASLFSLNEQRILIVVLGAENRLKQTQEIISYLSNKL
jgi:D-alanyl-D-alanine carboxypeptidase